MRSVPQCPKCGGELPPGIPPSFCPGCALLNFGLSDSGSAENQGESNLPGQLSSGTRVGRYEVVEPLGSGGAGDVYLAKQTGEVALKVAVKILRASTQSDRIVARFEAERDAMMRMDHPGIAKVLDAGFLDDGRPYVAMDYVNGESWDVFLQSTAMNLQERLQLFIRICQAVQHAHVKGVLHRDLKPTNILVEKVDQSYSPKLIDFGISRSIDRPKELDALFTQQSEILGTPAYMSPEQTLGGNADLDIRSDVYALGIILYELLTGSPPLQPDTLSKMGIGDTLQAIRDTPAARPSSLVAGIDRDLDAVTLKAISKEPERRYQSTGALAEDLERFLKHEPVNATPPTASYRISKFVRRNRASVVAATAVILAIISGAIISLHQAQQARIARDRAAGLNQLATTRLAASEDLIQFMVSDLYDQLKPIGKLETLSDTAQKVEAFYEDLGFENRSDESLDRQGKAILYLARVRSAQGNSAQAEATFHRGLKILTDAHEKTPDNEEIVSTLSNIWDSLGSHHLRQGNKEEAASAFAKAMELVNDQMKKTPDSLKWKNIAIGLLINASAMEGNLKHWQKSIDLLDLARELENAATSAEQKILIEQNRSRAFTHLEDLERARTAAVSAIKLNTAQLEEQPDDTGILLRQADLITNLSAVQYYQNDFSAVIDSNLRTIAIQEKLLGIEPSNIYWRDRLAGTYRRLALGYARSKLPRKASKQLDAIRNAIATREPLATADSASKALIKEFLSDVDYFEASSSQLSAWKEPYQLRVRTHSLHADAAAADLKLGRAASFFSLEMKREGQREIAESLLDLTKWILTKHPKTTESMLAKDGWFIDALDLSTPINKARLSEAVATGLITVPDSWHKELTEMPH